MRADCMTVRCTIRAQFGIGLHILTRCHTECKTRQYILLFSPLFAYLILVSSISSILMLHNENINKQTFDFETFSYSNTFQTTAASTTKMSAASRDLYC